MATLIQKEAFVSQGHVHEEVTFHPPWALVFAWIRKTLFVVRKLVGGRHEP